MSEQRAQVREIVGDRAYVEQVGAALDEALGRVVAAEGSAGPATLEVGSSRYIVFSDHHKGARDRADDFRHAERAYNAALAYYLSRGHTLVVLGDVEELWEERPQRVIASYRHSLGLEAQFRRAGRYLRVWGNHDDAWSFPDLVRQHLWPIFGPGLVVHEGLRLRVVADNHELGHLLLVHGHQGTGTSDRFSWLSRLVVRFVWRPFQRLTGVSLNTPAKDWVLREKHNIAMYSWAVRQPRTVLIAGHTHRPVFKSQSHAASLEEQLATLKLRQAGDPRDEQLGEQIALLAAELEWVRAQEGRAPGVEGMVEELIDPSEYCYFNTGCCSFVDGNITGIEIVGDEIRLVRWPDDAGEPRPKVLARATLREVFASLRPA